MKELSCQVAIVGAGPYGLSAAAHLRAANVDVRVFGEPMEFWQRQMPSGMLLRSYWKGSCLSDSSGELTLDSYQRDRGGLLPRPVRVEDFVRYGEWFQRRAVPDLDRRSVAHVAAHDGGYRLVLTDGDILQAQRVVVAAGIGAFARRPHFGTVCPALMSHSCEHRDFTRFSGRRVLVVGGGQSALESAALLHESGADVEVVVRAPRVRWLRHGSAMHTWLHKDGNLAGRVLYPPSDIGPPGLNWIVDTPPLFRCLPRSIQPWLDRRTTRPAGAGWLRPRLKGVPLTLGRTIISAVERGETLQVKLDDGSERTIDHALLATGYQVDISRYGFLDRQLVQSVRLDGGYPRLTAGFESSVPGLHFVGAPAARTYGPLMKFVAGTRYAAPALAARIGKRRPVRTRRAGVSRLRYREDEGEAC